MSKKIDVPERSHDITGWKALLEDIRAEIIASDDLTDEEKRLLDEMDQLPDEEWEPIACSGKPLSETVIGDRGER